MKYPSEWDKLPKHERKKKLKQLKRDSENRQAQIHQFKRYFVYITIITLIVIGIYQATRKSPEQIAFEAQVAETTLSGIQTFPIEGTTHVPEGTRVEYQTNPPTSGDHYANAVPWGVYFEEQVDEAMVHSLEHGGIWISYKDISEAEIDVLESIGRRNSQSVIVSPRQANDAPISVASWGKLMHLENADEFLIQKYIDTYKNQSPERLAR